MTRLDFELYINGKIAIEDTEKYIRPTSFKREEADGFTYTYYGVEFDVEDTKIRIFNNGDHKFAEINGEIVAKTRVVYYDSIGEAYTKPMQVYEEIHKYLYGEDYSEYRRYMGW